MRLVDEITLFTRIVIPVNSINHNRVINKEDY